MTLAKDTDNQIVLPPPMWVRVLGGFLSTLGLSCFIWLIWSILRILQRIGESPPAELLLLAIIFAIIIGPMLFLGGIQLLGSTIQVTFDRAFGNMTIRQRLGPLPYRTRHISKNQVQSVQSREEQILCFFLYASTLSLKIAGRKRWVNISTYDESRATYLKGRIRAFVGQRAKGMPRLSATKVSRGVKSRKISKYLQSPSGEIVKHDLTSLSDALKSLEQLPETELPIPEDQVPLTLGFEDEEGAFIEFFKEQGEPLWTARVDGYRGIDEDVVEVTPEEAVSIIEDFFLGAKLRFIW